MVVVLSLSKGNIVDAQVVWLSIRSNNTRVRTLVSSILNRTCACLACFCPMNVTDFER